MKAASARSRLTLIGSGLILLACGQEADVPESPIVQDSADVTVVENRISPDSLPTWTVAAEPVAVFGEEGPDGGLYRVTGTVRLDDGRVAIAHAGEHEIRLYEPDGSLAWSFGGEGEGPGEFRFPHGIWRSEGDTLLVWDPLLLRLTRIDGDGRLAETVAFEKEGFSNPPLPVGPVGEGGFVVISEEFSGTGPGALDARKRFHLHSRDGTRLTEIVSHSAGSLHEVGGAMGMEAFHLEPSGATGRNRIWIGASTSEEVRGYDVDGRPAMIVRWPAEDRIVETEHVQRYRQERASGRPGGASDEIRHAASFPAYDALRVDRSGNLWVRRYLRPGATGPRVWVVFDGKGTQLARAETPRDLEIHEIGSDHVVGVTRNEVDVERIEIRSLNRDREGPAIP